MRPQSVPPIRCVHCSNRKKGSENPGEYIKITSQMNNYFSEGKYGEGCIMGALFY